MQQDQTHTELHGVCCQPPRLQGDGARTDRAAQVIPRRTGVARLGMSRDGGCGESEVHDPVNLRERHEWTSFDRGAERATARSRRCGAARNMFLDSFMEQTMGGRLFRGVGMIRAKANIAWTNLVYNMSRLVQTKKFYASFIVIQ